MEELNSILNTYWINHISDPYPLDRRMAIMNEKGVHGFSSENIRFLINEIVRRFAKDGVYMEVGIYQGCSLLSAALNNPSTRCIGIDNFSGFNDGSNESILRQNLAKFGPPPNIEYYNMDYREAIRSIFAKEPHLKVDIYYYDGSHAYADQLEGLNLILPHLNEGGLIMVDDPSYAEVEQANYTFLNEHPEFNSIFKIKTDQINSEIWWNGFEVFAKKRR